MGQPRGGFTLIELLIAVAVLGAVILSLRAANGELVGAVARDRPRMQAMAAADARIALVRLWPTYASLDSAFAGTERDVPLPGWTRTTTVARIGTPGQANDVTRITVTVTAPGAGARVVRSLTVAAPTARR